MKNIFLVISLFVSVFVYGQPGYTTINARYNWLAGRFQALHLPGFSTTPSLQTGQWVGDGAVGIDTAANIMYFYSGGTWRAVGTGAVAGSTTQVQYNNAGAFGGISGATTNGTVMTLTSPVINVTSDATGDVYYRSSGGAFTRLPIGTAGQQLTVAGGIPSWAAAGGSTPTLDQVLAAGATLSTSRTINLGGLNGLTINNGISVVMQTVAGTEEGNFVFQPNETYLQTKDGSSNAAGTIIMHSTSDIALIATDGATYTDSISLGGHDAILKADSIFIRDGSLGAASAGYVLTLQNARGYAKWVAAGGGGGWGTTGTIATLTGASVLDLDGNSISFQMGGENILHIDPTPGSEVSVFNAYNETDDDNYAQLTNETSNTSASFEQVASFNNGVKLASFNGFADATTATFQWTADTHTFNGNVVFSNTARLKNYTVATLPAGTAGDMAYVTDALLPAFLTTIAGGGAVVTPVFYDGTNWKAF